MSISLGDEGKVELPGRGKMVEGDGWRLRNSRDIYTLTLDNAVIESAGAGNAADGNTVEKTSVNGQTKTITTGTDKDGKSFVSNDGVTNETSTDDFGRTTQVRTVRK